MRIDIISFILLCICCSTYSQDKPVYFYDINGLPISKELYINIRKERKEKSSVWPLVFENDTCYINTFFRRKNYGRLTETDFKKLNAFLNNSNTKPKSNYTIIQYHPGRDRCNGGKFYGNRYEKKYLKKLKKNYSFNNYWIHKKDTTIKFKNGRVLWQLDKNRIVEKLFFKYHYPCSSFVIINNETKNYIAIFGEYGDYTVVKTLEKFSEI
ncbi:hypothetical protein [Winogradskyella jejuensis]|uniref:Uncharacterized protein n=1 Tax=Winogradskyella jejuensis TaxID=1089305 RepID=A0A1M5TG08_9FLAO|nr:hypothetical protein [Winogradskyella jejuensis]SHH49303.1 hypothetical protein SAMN05444148_2147 [Winogradskyella jejuensis]